MSAPWNWARTTGRASGRGQPGRARRGREGLTQRRAHLRRDLDLLDAFVVARGAVEAQVAAVAQHQQLLPGAVGAGGDGQLRVVEEGGDVVHKAVVQRQLATWLRRPAACASPGEEGLMLETGVFLKKMPLKGGLLCDDSDRPAGALK